MHSVLLTNHKLIRPYIAYVMFCVNWLGMYPVERSYKKLQRSVNVVGRSASCTYATGLTSPRLFRPITRSTVVSTMNMVSSVGAAETRQKNTRTHSCAERRAVTSKSAFLDALIEFNVKLCQIRILCVGGRIIAF